MNAENQSELTPFVFDALPVRGKVLRLNNLVGFVPTLKDKPPALVSCLGDLLTIAAIVAHDLKNKANVTLQIHGVGKVPLLVAGCNGDGQMRAYAGTETGSRSYADIIADGSLFAVSIDQGGAAPYQSIVRLNQTSIASSMETYFADSVQLPTLLRVFTGTGENPACGAVFLQAMPDRAPVNEDDWNRLGLLLDTLKAEEVLPGLLTAKELLQRLFSEDTVRVFDSQPLALRNDNPRARMIDALKSLGVEVCRDMLAQGPIEMTADFSGQKEVFDEDALKSIFGADWPKNN